jgi:DNA-binding MarR family transcriptional regulator
MSPAAGGEDGGRRPAGSHGAHGRLPDHGTAGPGSSAARNRGLTLQAARVLQILVSDPSRARYYTELAGLTGMPAGTVHLALTRIADAGWVDSTVSLTDHGGTIRNRRLYKLTPAGQAAAPAALAAARAQLDAMNHDVALAGVRPAAGGRRGGAVTPDAGLPGQSPQMTLQAARILQQFAGEPSQSRYLTELASLTGMAGTTVRKILVRLGDAGWLADTVEDPAARKGCPGARRRLYTLTAAGQAAAPAALAAARRQLTAINSQLNPSGLEAGPG